MVYLKRSYMKGKKEKERKEERLLDGTCMLTKQRCKKFCVRVEIHFQSSDDTILKLLSL